MTNTQIWLGSPESYERVLEINKLIAKAPKSLKKQAESYDLKRLSTWGNPDEEDSVEDEVEHWMLEMNSTLAIISIEGPMVDGSAGWYGRYFGYTGYDDIKEAVLCGINAGATEFLFDWKTPGGSAEGIEDTSYFLENLAKEYPTTSHTSSQCASAGFWLATALDDFYCTPMAEVGSVGVVAVHTDVTKMLEMEGISKTVFRSAKYKHVGGPYEALTDFSTGVIQADIDKCHQFFVDVVVKHCNLDPGFVASDIATGQTWFGEEAKALGIISGIKTFDQLLIAFSKKSVENTNYYGMNYSKGGGMKKRLITAEVAGAIASGISPEKALADAPLVDEPETKVDEPESKVEDKVDEPETKVEASATQNPATESLQNQLIDAKVQLNLVSAKVTTLEAAQDGLKKIAALAIQRAFAGVGSPVPEMEGLMAMDPSLLIQQHAMADAQLQKKYPSGGRVSVEVDESQEEDASTDAAANFMEQTLQNLATFRPRVKS
jgi:ClpP class serine protease